MRLLRRLLSAVPADANQWRRFDQDRGLGRRQALERALEPTFHKLVVANLPNNPPRWPEVEEVVRKILYAYKENGRDFERLGEWIERIGWPRFFELTGFAFTKHHLDTWTGARKTMNMSAHVHF